MTLYVKMTPSNNSFYSDSGYSYFISSSIPNEVGISISGSYTNVSIKNESGYTVYTEEDSVGAISNGSSEQTFNDVTIPFILYDEENEKKLNLISICFPPFTKVQTDKGLTEIGNLKRGALVKAQRGLIPLTKNLITHTPLGANYVKFPKDIFSKGFPEEDLLMTKAHAFSLGLKEGTEVVWLWLEACQFIGHFGIEEVHLETKTYHNLIFDEQEEFSAEGMKVFSHHPNGNPYILPKDEYLNKVNEKERKIEAVSYETFIKDKPEEQDLKEYIAERLKF